MMILTIVNAYRDNSLKWWSDEAMIEAIELLRKRVGVIDLIAMADRVAPALLEDRRLYKQALEELDTIARNNFADAFIKTSPKT